MISAKCIRINGVVTKTGTTELREDTLVTHFTVAFINGLRPIVAQTENGEVAAYVDSESYIVLSAWEQESNLAAMLCKGQEIACDVTGMHAEIVREGNDEIAVICAKAENILPGKQAKNRPPNMMSMPSAQSRNER
jgi:hypothetical protein